jgi:hypothetical protein
MGARGAVLIGRSQGSRWLAELLQREMASVRRVESVPSISS